jgi:hypothetical protein
MNGKVSEDEMLHDCNSNEQDIDNRKFSRMTRKMICMSAVLNPSFWYVSRTHILKLCGWQLMMEILWFYDRGKYEIHSSKEHGRNTTEK